jgi:hypothetical protein
MVLLSCAFQQIKGSGRFKERGLQNEYQLEIMFENLHNTGDDHWSAGSDVAPSQSSDNSAIDLDVEDDPDNSDSEPEELTPTTEQNKRDERVNVNNKGKKPWDIGFRNKWHYLCNRVREQLHLLSLLQGEKTNLIVPSRML